MNMMKVLLMIVFMGVMICFNNLVVFYFTMCFLLSLIVLFLYMMNMGDFWILMWSYGGMDSYSYYMILMSLWVIGLMFMFVVVWGKTGE